jgi:hypothetical protein
MAEPISTLPRLKQDWDELRKKGEIVACTNCGKEIWKFWRIENSHGKGWVETDQCAPCYFNTETINVKI